MNPSNAPNLHEYGHGHAQLPAKVRILEVGPRDGLQNQQRAVATKHKAEWIRQLAAAGAPEIEITSFVHPRWVPQLADATDLCAELAGEDFSRFSALVPNLRGLESAMQTEIRRIALFIATSETFSHKNTNCSVAESLTRCAEIMQASEGESVWVRGYLSTAFGCPYEGEQEIARVVDLTRELFDLGVEEVNVSDTIGVATPPQVERVVGSLLEEFPAKKIALHFHDTRGLAIANVQTALALGIDRFDAAAGGLGGCPYAPGAAGNVATEELLTLLNAYDIETGVDLAKLAQANLTFETALAEPFPSRVLATYRSANDG